MYNGYIWQTTFKIKCTKNLSIMVQMWMVYKHKNVHTIIKASVWQFFADLTAGWVIREHSEKKLWKVLGGLLSEKKSVTGSMLWRRGSLRTSLVENANMGEHQELQSATGWTEKRSAVVGYHCTWSCKNAKNARDKKKDLKNPVLQYVPCQGNMEHNWMYGGEEGHWRISLVRKKKK